MIGLLCLFLALLASPFNSKSQLEAENAVLRHQLTLFRRKVQSGRLRKMKRTCSIRAFTSHTRRA
jgi:hypothetical protein